MALNSKSDTRQKLQEVENLLQKGISEIPPNIGEIMDEAFELANLLGDKKMLFSLNTNWAVYWQQLEQNEKSEFFNQIALKWALELGDDKSIAMIHNNLAVVNIAQNKLNAALHHLLKSLALYPHDNKFNIYSNIGSVFHELKKYNKALEYYLKALENAIVYPTPYVPRIHTNVGATLVLLNRYEEAITHFEQALLLMGDDPQYEGSIALCLENLGEVKLAQKKYDKSLQYLNRAIVINRKIRRFQQANKCLLFISRVYMRQEKYDKAFTILQEVLLFSSEKRSVLEHQEVLQLLIQCCKLEGKLEECIRFQNQLIELQSQYFYPQKKEKIEVILTEKEKEIDLLMSKNLQIKNQNRKLQQYNKELEEYAFIIAHDLKEPLCNITGFTSLISTKYSSQLDGELQQLLSALEGGTTHMHCLLEDLLMYSTLKIRKEKIRKFRPKPYVLKALEAFQEKISHTEAQIEVGELVSIQAEPKHFHWLIMQLIENALKFCHPTRTPNIQIYSTQRDGKTYIEIVDNGIGIEEAYQKKIFRIFQRLNKKDYDGTGIGLAICKKIVELYGGEIGLQSTLGEGTRVYFHFP